MLPPHWWRFRGMLPLKMTRNFANVSIDRVQTDSWSLCNDCDFIIMLMKTSTPLQPISFHCQLKAYSSTSWGDHQRHGLISYDLCTDSGAEDRRYCRPLPLPAATALLSLVRHQVAASCAVLESRRRRGRQERATCHDSTLHLVSWALVLGHHAVISATSQALPTLPSLAFVFDTKLRCCQSFVSGPSV